jgi:hypothetical protein
MNPLVFDAADRRFLKSLRISPDNPPCAVHRNVTVGPSGASCLDCGAKARQVELQGMEGTGYTFQPPDPQPIQKGRRK